MLSQLFADETVLQAVLENRDRISAQRHKISEATRRVQLALLIWDPECLPVSGADSDYGPETGRAVMRFKREELGVPESEIFNDVGPRTVERLDQIAAADEHGLGREFAVVSPDGVDQDAWRAIVDVAETAGGTLLTVLAPRVAAFDGGPQVADAVVQSAPQLVSAVITSAGGDLPTDLDGDTLDAITAWVASLDPVNVVSQLQAWAETPSLRFLEGCGQKDVAP